jgi:putative SOS response-associated peptidase YedK
MCGRYALASSYDTLIAHFGTFDHICYKPRYNIAPQQTIITILPGKRLQFMRWGFRPAWAKPDSPEYINARLETLLEKPAFKHAFLKQRCLIPATGYYDWQQSPRYKQPYYLKIKGASLIAFAGIWSLAFDPDFGGVRETVTILTKAAGSSLQALHETQPVVLTESDYRPWLSGEDLAALQPKLLAQEDNWIYYPVTRQVNYPTFDSEECLSPIGQV